MTEQKTRKAGIISLIITAVMLIVVVVTLFITRNNPNTFGLEKVVVIYLITLAGFIIAFVIGLKSKGKIKIVSIASSTILFGVVGVLTFLLAIANEISEP